MKIHPRTLIVQGARGELRQAVCALQSKHQLTGTETIMCLTEEIQSVAKHMLREERHPDNPSQPADVE